MDRVHDRTKQLQAMRLVPILKTAFPNLNDANAALQSQETKS